MKYNIYQIAYSIKSLNPIDPSFKIFDQTKNSFPEYREGNVKLLKTLLKNIDRIRMGSNNQNFIKKLHINARLILKQKIF
jgi:hypothetical protein